MVTLLEILKRLDGLILDVYGMKDNMQIDVIGNLYCGEMNALGWIATYKTNKQELAESTTLKYIICDNTITYNEELAYYAVGGFEENLKCESFIVEKQALYVVKNLNGEYNSQEIEIPEDVRDAYINFLSIFKNRRQLPSLAYYDEDLCKAAEDYVITYQKFLSRVKEGDILSPEHNNTLKLGMVYDPSRNSIAFSPVHPLNVMYQLQIRQELGLGSVRDDIVNRLTSAN